MNTLKFEVYKNTLKRRDGFNPVLGEKKYTKIKCYFMESDWDNCSLVTGNFMSEKDNVVKSTVSLTEDKTAVFDIPSGLEGDKIYFSLTGSYADDSGNTVTLNTNLVGINRQKGMLPSEAVDFGLYEQILSLYNKMKGLYNQLKNEKISKSEGSIVTAYLADGAVTKAKLSSDLNTLAGYGITDAYTKEKTDQKLAQKLNSMPFDSEPKQNSPCYLTSGAVYNALLAKADKASTLAGYGITDAYTKERTDQKLAQKLNSMPFDSEPTLNSLCYLTSGAVYNALLAKADKASTLAGYGITDAYTKERTDQKLARKLDSMPFDSEPTNNSPCYLTSGAVYNALLAKADKASTLAGYGIINAYTKTEMLNFLAKKEDNLNRVSSKTDITDSNTNYPSIKYLNDFYYDASKSYSAEETDELLGNKADVNSVYSKTESDKLLGNKADKADVDDVKAYIGYTDSDILGLQVDFENKTFKRLAGAVNLSQGADFNKFEMYGGRRRCNVLDDGTIVAYYGDENYAEDGSNGQVMVFQPKFYYKVVPLKLEKNTDSGIGYHLRRVNYYVSSKPKTGFKLHPAFFDENGNAINYILFSADEGSMYDVSAKAYVNDGTNTDTVIEAGDLLCSVANVKPISGLKKPLNKVNLETMAQNRGSGWHLETIKATSANQLLMMIELGIMSTQNSIGQGVVSITGDTAYNCSSLTGSTAELGNSTGQAVKTINEIGGVQTTETADGKTSVSYRGVENPWGNISKHINGINVWGDGSMGGGQPYIADDFNFSESKKTDNYKPVGFTLSNANGFIKAMGYGSEEYDWLFMPSEIGGTSALPVGDIVYTVPNLNGYRIVQQGGSCRSGDHGGSFSLVCNGTVGDRSRNAGGRLLYVPTAKSGNTPTKSYSASEVDSLLAAKYDSSNIELGTATLTPYSTQIDKIKSATCLYEKIGDIVIVNVTVIMNATSLGGTSAISLLNMPFSNKSDVIVHDIGISKNGGMFRANVTKSAWLQFTPLNKQAYNFVADEQVNFSLIYKI